jgi:hypothetical protein
MEWHNPLGHILLEIGKAIVCKVSLLDLIENPSRREPLPCYAKMLTVSQERLKVVSRPATCLKPGKISLSWGHGSAKSRSCSAK